MEQPTATSYTISDFLEWDASRQLILTPKFQRRDVWIQKAKSYLIDTILRTMPIPPLFIRLKIDPLQKRSLREVVDGQQRLRAVLGYIHGDFPVMQVHNQEYGGLYYVDLPDDTQRQFLGYKFLVNVLQDVSDSDVLNIFSRMNAYTERLKDQELRNAQFFGGFKQTVYELAHQHYAFWRNNNILSDRLISRMADAELTSELIVSMLDGVRQTKAKDLREFYIRYDDEFPQSDRIKREFENIINIIGNLFGSTLSQSQFRRAPLFYSLFCILYDAKYGMPNSEYPHMELNSTQLRQLIVRIWNLDNIIKTSNPSPEFQGFMTASKVSTANPIEKRVRHRFMWDYLLLPITGNV